MTFDDFADADPDADVVGHDDDGCVPVALPPAGLDGGGPVAGADPVAPGEVPRGCDVVVVVPVRPSLDGDPAGGPVG